MLIAIYKSAEKVQQIFEIHKDLHKKTHPKMRFFYLGCQSFYTPSDRAEGDIPRCQEQHQEPGRVAYRCRIGHFTDRVVIITPIPRGSSPRSALSKQRTAGFGIAEGVSIDRSGTELVRRCGRYIGSGSGGLIYGLIPPVLRLRIGGISVREGCCMTHATHHPKHQYTPY